MADADGGGQLEGMGYHKVDDVDGGNEDYESRPGPGAWCCRIH